MFSLNSVFLYTLAGVFILFVVIQALFFLFRAINEAKRMKMDMSVVRNTIKASAVFTIAPAISILLGVISLAKFLGLPLPWLRLSILGAITYELSAAASAAASLGIEISNAIGDAETYVTIAWVMTIGIIPSIVLIPLFLKKLQGGMGQLKKNDPIWSEHFTTAIFLGMISAFLGVVFKDIRQGITGFIPIFVLLFSGMMMAIVGILIKRFKFTGLRDYALPISMLSSMAFAVFISAVIGG